MKDYKIVLQDELKAALGCTEPIAVALASAKAAEVLGEELEMLKLYCSRNVIKNANSVVVPKTNGLKGIRIAAMTGAVGGDASMKLEVMNSVTKEDVDHAAQMIRNNQIEVHEKKEADGLYIEVHAIGGGSEAIVVIDGTHDHFALIQKDGQVISSKEAEEIEEGIVQVDKDKWSVQAIYDTAKSFVPEEHEDITCVLDRVIAFNMAISQEGLAGNYGLNVGKFYLEGRYDKNERREIIGRTAAASDARMGGCNSPVVINSGSGNQGITSSVPVIVYAQKHGHSKEELYKALVFSNLMAIYQKHFQGMLSSFCGVVSAATASVGAIGFLKGMTLEQISQMISISLSTGGGIFCAGANAMCASKIAVSLHNAFLALELIEEGEIAPTNEGLSGADADHTIREVGRLAKNSMQRVDDEILQIMLSRYEGEENPV